ncbi:MAG: hypothetical protein M0R17_03145 [Candidatus Omnitrophica bacterium]|nr:hypothetical protein [Candidatus Omnitrophota bacterium]
MLLHQNKSILYYNPSKDIDQEFVKKYHQDVYQNVIFHKESLSLLINFLEYINYEIDYLILDPGDALMVSRNVIPMIKSSLKGHIIITSQIRQDPTKNGHIYSPIEELNKKYNLFKYSIWIRNVTEEEQLFKSRYIDIFENCRIGNQFLRRYLVRFDSKTGEIIT